jgi:hypothetical protein
MKIKARNLGLRRQNGSQLQLCVPLVITSGDSYRMKQARTKGGTPLTKP